jgi:hypothetical protein
MDHEQALATLARVAPDVDVPAMLDGSSADLADRLILLDHTLRILREVRGHLADELILLADTWPLERPGGTLDYEPPKGNWAYTDRPALIAAARRLTVDDLATNIATGEVDEVTRRIASTAIERFVASFQPSSMTPAAALGQRLDLNQYREWRNGSGAHKVTVVDQ